MTRKNKLLFCKVFIMPIAPYIHCFCKFWFCPLCAFCLFWLFCFSLYCICFIFAFCAFLALISRCNFFLPKRSLHMLYYSLIYPYFYYCNIVWASTYKTNLRRLVILQKRIIRIINKSHFNAHTDPIFKDLGILKFNDIHLLQLGQFMYSCKNSFLPPRFNSNFSQSNQFHSYNTRNSQA